MSMQNPTETALSPEARAAIDARVGVTLRERYTLEQVLGVGATGAVYRGSHRNGNRVAVEVVHATRAATPEARAALVAAANEANRVDHPGAVRILDDDSTDDGHVFLVRALVEGQSLAEVLARAGGRLAPPDVVPVVLQLLEVLGAAHAKGIVHGAVSPAKMIVSSQRSLHLLGFGTSRPGPHGTSPEQARGEAPSAQTDLWAVGAVLFAALAGRAVNDAPPLASVAPHVERALGSVVDRALAFRREDRFPDAATMAAALRAAGLPVVITSFAPPPGPTYPPPPAPFSNAPPPYVTVPPPFSNAPPPYVTAPPPYVTAPPPPGFVMPQPSDTGWVKWVVGGIVLVMMLVVLTGGAVAIALRSRAPQKPNAEAIAAALSDSTAPVPVYTDDATWGDREAPITIVAFSDFQCPFCRKVEPTLEQVKTTYGPAQVRLVWKNDPLTFHADARPAARSAQAVLQLKGSAAFFRFHDLAFANPHELGSADARRGWAVQAGVDGHAYDTLLAAPAGLDAKIDNDIAVAKSAGAKGTPTFRINGLELAGAQPFAKWKELIDAELVAANALAASGTAPAKVYGERTKVNFTRSAAEHESGDGQDDEAATVWRVPIEGSPVRGNVDAPVTLVEVGDFQCPFCKRGASTVDKLRATYGDRLRVVWKHEPLPFHVRAEPAAELALEARAEKGDAGFWRAHDMLFESQPRLEDADLVAVGLKLGLDAAKVRSALRDKRHKKDIERDVDLLAGLAGPGAMGTPTYFINGRKITGAQPFEKLDALVDAELARFDAQSSVAAKDWYATVMRDAKAER